MHISLDGVLLELVWTFHATFHIGSNSIIHHIKMLMQMRGTIMTDPEIRLNILREENELHIFIDHLANMTPHEIADLVEDIAGILRTLPQKPLKHMSAADPEFTKGDTSSHGTGPMHQVLKDSWN